MLRSIVVVVALAVAGCRSEPAAAPPPAAAPALAAADPVAAFGKLDARQAVPLLPMMANHQKQNMREHLQAVQEIVAAVAADDFAAVEKAAGRLGYSEQMGQMCTHLGAGAPGFTEQALAFHHTADRIAAAAKRQDKAQVLVELSATLAACTACHAQWRQQLVDQAGWQRATASAPPMGHGP